jgi:hypothetical protein
MLPSLRKRSLPSAVVAAASVGDYESVVRLAASGLWQAGDEDAVVAALLSAASLHDVHCRRGIGSALHGRATRSRALLRSAEFAGAYGRCVAAGTVGLGEALRLLRMGAPPWLLTRTALRSAPEWGSELLRSCLLLPRLPLGRVDEAVDLALGSARPGDLLRPMLELGVASSFALLRRRPDVADNAALLEQLAADADFLASRPARPLAPLVLKHACRTGSAQLVGAIEALRRPITRSLRDTAVGLCKQHARGAHLVERVGALPLSKEPGLMALVAYGAQESYFGNAQNMWILGALP